MLLPSMRGALGTGDCERAHDSSTGAFERGGTVAKRRAGRNDVVHEQNRKTPRERCTFADKASAACKRVAGAALLAAPAGEARKAPENRSSARAPRSAGGPDQSLERAALVGRRDADENPARVQEACSGPGQSGSEDWRA